MKGEQKPKKKKIPRKQNTTVPRNKFPDENGADFRNDDETTLQRGSLQSGKKAFHLGNRYA